MRIHLVTKLHNGKGLERDYRLLRGILTGWGHHVRGVDVFRPGRVGAADLAIFLECYDPRFAALAPRRWLIPNPEWWSADATSHTLDFEFVLCKTSDALERFLPLTPRARWLGFTSHDQYVPSVARMRRFVHVAGGSGHKGTSAVLRAWQDYRLAHPLTVVCFAAARPAGLPPGVEWWGRVDEASLCHLQNQARFHLCPSEYEGWGHTIHESLSVGAAVAVTGAPPLSEIAGVAHKIPPASFGAQGLARTAQVSPAGVRDAVEACAATSDAELDRIAVAARAAFLDERERFLANLWELIGGGEQHVHGHDGSP
jgi:hypothetical protein